LKTHQQNKLDGAPDEGDGGIAIDENLDDIAELAHALDKLCDSPHIPLLSLRSQAVINAVRIVPSTCFKEQPWNSRRCFSVKLASKLMTAFWKMSSRNAGVEPVEIILSREKQ
jgi:hypothetical protein